MIHKAGNLIDIKQFNNMKEIIGMDWWKKYGDKVRMGCVEEQPYVQHPQDTSECISLLKVDNLYWTSLIQSKCICNAKTLTAKNGIHSSLIIKHEQLQSCP